MLKTYNSDRIWDDINLRAKVSAKPVVLFRCVIVGSSECVFFPGWDSCSGIEVDTLCFVSFKGNGVETVAEWVCDF